MGSVETFEAFQNEKEEVRREWRERVAVTFLE